MREESKLNLSIFPSSLPLFSGFDNNGVAAVACVACVLACLLAYERARVLPAAGAALAVEHGGELRPPVRSPVWSADRRTDGRPEAAVCGSGESADDGN